MNCEVGCINSSYHAGEVKPGWVYVDNQEDGDRPSEEGACTVIADVHAMPFVDGAFEFLISGACIGQAAGEGQEQYGELVRVAKRATLRLDGPAAFGAVEGLMRAGQFNWKMEAGPNCSIAAGWWDAWVTF